MQKNHLKDSINYEALKEDFRQLGINLITAGIGGLFITDFIGATLTSIISASWVILVGVVLSLYGVRKQND